MSTNDSKVNLYLKKFMPRDHMDTNFLEYLRNLTLDVMADMFPEEGFFQGGTLSAGGSDKFTLSTPLIATDGLGHRLAPDPADVQQVQFENELAALYYVGLRYNEVPTGTEVNVRTGDIEYTFVQEAIGELGQPDSVVDNGSTITFVVDAVTQAGVSNAGRKVRVWLKGKASAQVDAFFEGTVAWDGSNNKITTTHLLGQEIGSVSVDAADYEVFLIGPTVKRAVDLDTDPAIAFVGVITGAGAGNSPSVFDQTGQNLLVTAGAVNDISNEVKSYLVGGGLITWDLDTETLTWVSDLKVILPHQSYQFLITADAIAGLADGEAVYIELDSTGGARPTTKAAVGSVPNNSKVYVFVIRDGNDIFFKNGALQLLGDVGSSTSGRIDGVTQDILDYIGADDESDGDPSYASIAGDADDVLTQGDNLTLATSKLHGAIRAINTNNPAEAVAVADGINDTFTLPFNVDTDNTVLDLETFVDGRRQHIAQDGVFDQPYKNYRKISLTQVQFAIVPPAGKVLGFWKQGTAYGGTTPPSAGNIWSDQLDSSITPNADAIHDIGSSTRRIRQGWFQSLYATNGLIEKTQLGEIKQIVTLINGNAAILTKGFPIGIREADGKILPADSDGVGTRAYVGIPVEDIAIAGSGPVLLIGRMVPGILTGMGFVPGKDIYLSETPGVPFTDDLGSFTGLDDDIIRVGISSCAENTSAALATDLIFLNDVVSRA